jgi:signal transduction histidine kinase
VEQAVVATDVGGVVTFWNWAAERLYGWTRAEAVGRPAAELIGGGPAPAGESWRGELRAGRRDGSAVLVHRTDSPLFTDAGEPDGTVSVSVEAGGEHALREARDRARQAAEMERKRLRTVFSTSPALVAVLRGPDHVFELANPPFRALVGGLDPVGLPVRVAVPEWDDQGHFELLDGVYASGRAFLSMERALRHDPAGSGRPETGYFNIVYQPLTGEAGEVDAVLMHAVNVTDQVCARRAAESAREEAERARAVADDANRAKSQFLANMSHEIRTPINAIMGYTEILEMGLSGPMNAQQRAQMTRIRASSTHLLGLVNEVLDFAKIEAGQFTVLSRTIPLLPTVLESLTLIEAQAATRGVRVMRSMECAPRSAFVGDEDRVRQILVNLLSNAVKFTQPGGRVVIRCARAAGALPATLAGIGGSWLAISVEDTGVGIPAHALGSVFDPFVQVDASYTREAGGTGLGLTISRRLARLMGGDLAAVSTPGVGSVFTLFLPAADAEARPAPPAHRVAGLMELGNALAHGAEAITYALGERIRADPGTPVPPDLDRVQLADHTSTLLVDLGLSLAALGDASGEPALAHDGTEIQKVIAEKHGAQRARLGWNEDAMRREFEILREEAESAVRSALVDGPGVDLDAGLALLGRLLDQAEELSVRGLKHNSD